MTRFSFKYTKGSSLWPNFHMLYLQILKFYDWNRIFLYQILPLPSISRYGVFTPRNARTPTPARFTIY